MASALIGYTGFVGTTLLRQTGFENLYRSTNIAEMEGRSFDLAVCAGAPAQKWIANRNPEADRANIDRLIQILKSIRCGKVVLISTVDVFKRPLGVDEETVVEEGGLHPYGLNRRRLERAVADRFPDHLILRLPGLVGPGLRKNIIYDILNGNNLQAIDSRAVFQFYPTVNLWYDIEIALGSDLRLVHLTAEPVSVADIARLGFGRPFEQTLDNPPALYDFQSKHSDLYGKRGSYQYTKQETLLAVRAYAQSEPKTVKTESKKTS